ncbi:MAG: N-acetylmannosamine-6-phosphate 2-epimerase [Selenomonadaceae bacterium]
MLEEVKGKLIVSCQALPDEPLHSPFIMGRMARAAKEGGAVAIRAQSVDDIVEIKKVTGLPVIGLIKRNYKDSEIYITATMREVEELLMTHCEMIAIDMTDRARPQGEKVEDLVERVHEAGVLVLADISTYEDGVKAAAAGADALSTTMAGYTSYSKHIDGPDVELVGHLVKTISVPIFAEGKINCPQDVTEVMQAGAYAAIVGSAITRPQLITAKFAAAIS